uniref:ORF57 n=1 Tax=Saccharolobus islandicus TaxID=43080 RepID=Q9C4X7_SACIS|nr:ORF57 [Sulfolobus islandicus]CAG38198.1 hypothetical protein [Sulfolobus islandicus]CDF47312.1 unnamed protein product [Sulfolobus islandicus]
MTNIGFSFSLPSLMHYFDLNLNFYLYYWFYSDITQNYFHYFYEVHTNFFLKELKERK